MSTNPVWTHRSSAVRRLELPTTSQEAPGSWERGPGTGPSLLPSEGTGPCAQLDFRLETSRTVRQHISV